MKKWWNHIPYKQNILLARCKDHKILAALVKILEGNHLTRFRENCVYSMAFDEDKRSTLVSEAIKLLATEGISFTRMTAIAPFLLQHLTTEGTTLPSFTRAYYDRLGNSHPSLLR